MASSSSLSPDLKIALDAQTAVLVAALDKRFAKLDAEFDRIFAKWLPPIDAKPLVVDAVPTAQIHLVDAVPDAHLDPVAVPNARIDHDDADAGFVAFMTPLLPPTEEIHPVAVPAAHPVAVQGEQIDLDVMPLHHHAARRVTTNTGSPQIHRDAEPPRRVAATTGVTLGKCALGYTADTTAPIHRDAARRRSRCFRLQCRRRPPRHWLRRRRRQRQAAEGTYRSLPPQPPAGSRHLVCPGVVRLNASESAASVRNIHEESVTALQVPVLEMFLTDLHVAQSTRVKGICLGIMGNLSCHESLVNAMSLQNGLLATVVYQLFLDDSACPCGTFRLLAAILSCTKSHELLQSILMPSRGCWNSMSKERQQGFLSVRLDVLQDSYRKVDWLSVFTTSDVQSLVKEKGSWCFSDCSIGDGKKYWDTELVGNIQRLNLITLIPGAPPVSISTPAWVDEYKLHGMPSAVVSHGMMNKLLPWYENFYRRPWPPPLWLIEKLSATELYWLWKPPCPSISYAIAVVLVYHVARLLYEVQAYVGSAGCEFTEGTLQRKCGGNCQLFILESFDAWLQCSVNFWWSRITSLHSKRWKLLIASGIRNNIFHPVLCSCAAYGKFYWIWKLAWPLLNSHQHPSCSCLCQEAQVTGEEQLLMMLSPEAYSASVTLLGMIQANGGVIHCESEMFNAVWSVQKYDFTSCMKVLPLPSYDMCVGTNYPQELPYVAVVLWPDGSSESGNASWLWKPPWPSLTQTNSSYAMEIVLVSHGVLLNDIVDREFYWHWKQPWPPPNLLEFLLDSEMIRPSPWPNFFMSAILVVGFKTFLLLSISILQYCCYCCCYRGYVFHSTAHWSSPPTMSRSILLVLVDNNHISLVLVDNNHISQAVLLAWSLIQVDKLEIITAAWCNCFSG